MDEDVRKKLNHVQQWLKNVFAEQEIPDYEINSQTVDVLYALATQSERKTALAKITQEHIEQETEEYIAETNRLKLVCEWLGLTINELSPAAKAQVQSLAASAFALDLRECSDTSFCLSLSELCCQRAKNDVMRREMRRDMDCLRESLRQLLLKEANQKRVLGEVANELKTTETSTLSKQMKEAEFLKQKTSQYRKLVSTMKEELNQMEYKPNISHVSLQGIAKEVEDLQTELAPLKAQLASYQDLPPDLDLAKVKLHEARRCLATLEEEFSRTVDLVHTEK